MPERDHNPDGGREVLEAGVVGFPLQHSISPQFQQPAFDHHDIRVRYRLHEIPPDGIAAFLARMRQGGWLGCNVTIPHKRAAFDGVDERSPEAEAIGAVNTILVHGDRLLGHNTDAEGFMRALREQASMEISGKDAVLLGAGGAALAVAVGLGRAGVRRLWIANRSSEKAQTLAERVSMLTDARALPLTPQSLREPLASSSLLVNCTSVGMSGGPAPGESPVPMALLGAHLLVYDLVYNPARTPLLENAEHAGARTLEGLPMLIYQGAASFERWTGRPAPVELMLSAGRRALAERQSQ